MDKQSIKGIVIKQKIIQAENPTLVLVKIQLNTQEEINAIIAKNALTFMLDVTIGDEVSLYGHYNSKKQFVIEKYLTANKISNQTVDLPHHLKYPKRKDSE